MASAMWWPSLDTALLRLKSCLKSLELVSHAISTLSDVAGVAAFTSRGCFKKKFMAVRTFDLA